jgi:hypothetical protein
MTGSDMRLSGRGFMVVADGQTSMPKGAWHATGFPKRRPRALVIGRGYSPSPLGRTPCFRKREIRGKNKTGSFHFQRFRPAVNHHPWKHDPLLLSQRCFHKHRQQDKTFHGRAFCPFNEYCSACDFVDICTFYETQGFQEIREFATDFPSFSVPKPEKTKGLQP